MRRRFSIILGLFLAGFTIHAERGWRPLWNGRNLDGWTTWMRQPEPGSELPGLTRDADGKYVDPIGSGRDPLKVFTVVADTDGRPAIRISGEVFGELRTKASFKDYHLRLQFKWGAKRWPPRDQPGVPRDSGLLYHVHAEPGAEGRTWARSIELQIQEHDVGDLYAVGSAIAVRAKRRAGTQPALYDYDPAGEWNTVELICLRDESIHIVNGKVVMRLHSPTRINGDTPTIVTSVPIILQSEGAEIFYRDIEIRPINAVPPEFGQER